MYLCFPQLTAKRNFWEVCEMQHVCTMHAYIIRANIFIFDEMGAIEIQMVIWMPRYLESIFLYSLRTQYGRKSILESNKQTFKAHSTYGRNFITVNFWRYHFMSSKHSAKYILGFYLGYMNRCAATIHFVNNIFV